MEPLPWDTEFFGIGIGRLHPDDTDPSGIAEAEAEARRLGIECLYASLDPAHAGMNIALQRHGFRLVEVVMDLIHPDNICAVVPETDSVVRDGTLEDLPALEEEIALMAPWSRFAVDPRFGPDAARRMHRAWVERAAGPSEHRKLVVAEDDTGITGFSTQSTLPGERPRIDLMASTKSGSGAAYAMIDHQFRQFGEGTKSWGGPIAARNVPTLRFCEHVGYRTGTVRYLYHRWLDEAAPAAGSLPPA
jgi:hypothetical protein